MEIRLTPQAHSDILGIYEYAKKDGDRIARNQINYIYESLERLATFPNMGLELQKHVERPTSLRYLVIHKVYIAVYDITDFIEILRVFRKEQDFISILGIDIN